MELIVFLLVFPLVSALALWFLKGQRAREVVVYVSSGLIIAGVLLLALRYLMGPDVYFAMDTEVVSLLLMFVDIAINIVIIAFAVRFKKTLPIVLAAVQLVLVFVFEFIAAPQASVAAPFYVDAFSTIMALIIGIIGCGICIYALGYMEDFSAHDAINAPRVTHFFSIMFLFLSAMFLIVFSNDLSWLFCGWEITTLCSFLLISFTRTDEAIANATRQIVMNLLGGIAFAVGNIWIAMSYGFLGLDMLVDAGAAGFAAFPIALLAFAAITKCAQMPFHSWLLGAMVAPTPTSALLHSSTMVKAGVFLLVRLSPAFGPNVNGTAVMMVGAITFILCAAMAISQTNAKRVLAYSTISNLGLIVLCAGLGTPEGVWAAIFLIIFHAAAKSLLFLCVGTAEHHIGSRDIESMDDLFVRMPKLARFMAVGMMAMFVAPFGMLVSKWAAIVSVIATGDIALVLVLCFGSALTFVFWAKWLGKVTAVATGPADLEKTVHRSEWVGMYIMLAVLLFCCVALPWISSGVVVPYLAARWTDVVIDIPFTDLLLMTGIVVFLIVAYLAFFGKSRKRHVDVYLSGVGTDFGKREFVNAMSTQSEATGRNLYLDGWFGEKMLTLPGNIVCGIMEGLAIGLTLLGVGMVM